MARPRVDEGDRSLSTAPGRTVDELHTVQFKAHQGLREALDLEADVMEALPLRGKKAGDAGRVIGGLDELDLGLPYPEEGDPDTIGRDIHHRLEGQSEGVAPEPERVVDGADDERHVMHATDVTDRCWERSRWWQHPAQRTLRAWMRQRGWPDWMVWPHLAN